MKNKKLLAWLAMFGTSLLCIVIYIFMTVEIVTKEVSIPIEISILFGNSEHPFPERKNMPFRSRVQPFI